MYLYSLKTTMPQVNKNQFLNKLLNDLSLQAIDKISMHIEFKIIILKLIKIIFRKRNLLLDNAVKSNISKKIYTVTSIGNLCPEHFEDPTDYFRKK